MSGLPPPPDLPRGGGGGGLIDCWNVGKVFAGSDYKLTQHTCGERTHFSRELAKLGGGGSII
jgi:hypothetical protein